MSFWDDINRALGYPPKNRNDPWAKIGSAVAGVNLSLSGVMPSSTDPLAAPPSSPHAIDLSDAIANQQSRSQGFFVFDVIPQKLDNNTFASQVRQTVINDITGYEGDSEQTAATAAYKGTAWRTIQLPTMGNFLKIEFLPGKTNYLDAKQVLIIAAGGISTDPLSRGKEDTGFAAQDVGGAVTPAFGPHSDPGTTAGYEKELSRQILVQFDNLSGPLLFAQNGTVFKTAFQTAYIHVKTSCCNFRVTTGFNSSVIEPGGIRSINSNPAFGPGHGLWENPGRHCTGFSINTGGTSSPNSSYLVTGAPTRLATIFNEELAVFGMRNGLAVGWINNFSVAALGAVNSGILFGEIWLQITRASGYKPKIICSLVVVNSVIGAGSYPTANVGVTFNNPKRFMLKPGDKLEIWGSHDTVTANNDFQIRFAIEGYVYGKILCKENTIGTTPDISSIPGFILDQVTSDPFPLDQLENNIV